MLRLSREDRILIFNQWYTRTGHWVYPSRERAFADWTTRGIEGLPDYR